MNNEKLTKQLIGSIPNRGITVSLKGNVITAGLVVGINNNELKLDYKSDFYLTHYITTWLLGISDSTNYVGLWLDDEDNVVLDEVEVYSKCSINQAIRRAISLRQRSMYSLDTDTTLWIENIYSGTQEDI